jgi:hypothetical protein
MLSLIDTLAMLPSTLGRLCHADELMRLASVSKSMHRIVQIELALNDQRDQRDNCAEIEAVHVRWIEHQRLRASLTAAQQLVLDVKIAHWWSQIISHPPLHYTLIWALNLGGRLHCDDSELGPLNLGQFVAETVCQEWVSGVQQERFYERMAEVAECAFITNPHLWHNKYYVGNGGVNVLCLLLHSVSRATQKNLPACRAAHSLLIFLIRLLHVLPLEGDWSTTRDFDTFLFRKYCCHSGRWEMSDATLSAADQLEVKRLQRQLVRQLGRSESCATTPHDQNFHVLIQLPYDRLDLLLLVIRSRQWLSAFRSVPVGLLQDGLIGHMVFSIPGRDG